MNLNEILEQIRSNSIKKITFRGMSIDYSGATAIADALKTNTALTSLDLSFNNVGDSGATAIANALKANTALTLLNLYGNQISASGATAIADALKTHTSLTTLRLDGNEIGASGATAIADALETNTTLATLNLHDNNIGDSGAKAIADALKTNTALASLALDYSKIGDSGAEAIADALKTNTSLTWIDLSGNNVDASLLETIRNKIATNWQQAEALIVAATAGDLTQVQQLVQAKASLNYRDNKGNTALHYAALNKHQAIVDYLIKPQQRLLANTEDTLPLISPVVSPTPVLSQAAPVTPAVELPDDYYCPITSQLMHEPVIAADGESYEREAITEWLKQHMTSPKTGEEMEHTHLITNKSLKRVINEALEKHPALKDSEDYYVPYAVKQQVLQAVKAQDRDTLKRLLAISRQLLNLNLAAVPVTTQPTMAIGNKQHDIAQCYATTSTANEVTPVYLLPLVCEHGDKDTLALVLTQCGAQLNDIVQAPDSIMMSLAQHQPDNLHLLGQALGFEKADYLRLLQAAPAYAKHWLKAYLHLIAEPQQPAALQALATQAIEQGELSRLQQLVQLGASLQTTDEEGNGLLHLAAYYNQEAIALWLMEQGCSEKQLNNQQQRPRDVAAVNEHGVLAETLTLQHQRQKMAKHMPFFISSYQQRIEKLEEKLAQLEQSRPSLARSSQGLFANSTQVTQSELASPEDKDLSPSYPLQ